MNGAGTRKRLNGYGDSPVKEGLGSLPTDNGGMDRHSARLDPDDMITMHLLTEHALGDSQAFRVLSVDEVEGLKSELPLLASRIDETKRKVAIESKLRDTARSMTRLDSLTSRGALKDEEPNYGKHEDLLKELSRLEGRSHEVQQILLEHTAGILQMTHKGYVEKEAPQSQGKMNGLGTSQHDPGLLNHDFDDESFYTSLDIALDGAQGQSDSAAMFKQQKETIADVERKLGSLNQQIRDAIVEASAGREAGPPLPALDSTNSEDVGPVLQGHIKYMQDGLSRMQRNQSEAIQRHKQSENLTEVKLRELNTQLRKIVVEGGHDETGNVPQPPEVSRRGAEGQITFLSGGLNALDVNVRSLKSGHAEMESTRSELRNRVGQYDSTFQNLWHKILSNEEANRSLDGAAESVPRERFSMETFASKVEMLNNRTASLQQQKDILGRQIQQQREINSKSDGERDSKLASVITELEQTKLRLGAMEKDAERQVDASRQAQEQKSLETQSLKQEQERLRQIVETQSAESNKARDEMREVEGEMVRLQTELTVARAELDGAYGTRAQRAAEVAQHPALVAEVAQLKEDLAAAEAKTGSANAELTARVQTLQKELTDTIGEYEIMTKSSIEFEKERETLEGTIDHMRDRCENLETQLSDEKVRWLGMKSPGVAGDRSSSEKGATSTSVLKNEFKKMMRETRAENMRALRYEQDERRKLEVQLRALKKDQTPGKSSLSQSMTAS